MINHLLAGVIVVSIIAVLCTGNDDIVGQARVIDGDTLEINHQRIRLWGIDAPESQQTCNNQPCGLLATQYLQKLVWNNPVTCYPKDKDRYSRIVAQCNTSEIPDLGRLLVATGHAIDYTRYSRGYYKDEQDAARVEKLGIWAGPFALPEDYRRQHKK